MEENTTKIDPDKLHKVLDSLHEARMNLASVIDFGKDFNNYPESIKEAFIFKDEGYGLYKHDADLQYYLKLRGIYNEFVDQIRRIGDITDDLIFREY